MATTEPDPRTRHLRYVCKVCGPDIPHTRDELTVKRVQFTKPGRGGAVVRSRTVANLCPHHLEQDEDYNRKAYADSPGMANTRLNEEDDGPTTG